MTTTTQSSSEITCSQPTKTDGVQPATEQVTDTTPTKPVAEPATVESHRDYYFHEFRGILGGCNW